MGILIDTSVLISAEKAKLDIALFYSSYPSEEFFLSAVTYSELLHGWERAVVPVVKEKRKQFIDDVISVLRILAFGAEEAPVHAQIWARLASRGQVIGSHDLLIAATALRHKHSLATLNTPEFSRVPDLSLIDLTPFILPSPQRDLPRR